MGRELSSSSKNLCLSTVKVFCRLLGQGICYPLQLRDNHKPDRNFWSGFVKAKCQPLANSMVFLVEDICRKVVLYPSDHNFLTEVDYT